MNCPEKENNLQNCNCSYPCAKKGNCCQCLLYHRKMRQLPACFFPADEEKTYDRSYENFVRLVQAGKI
ncbi:MAG: DUF6485 family protein [Candidatus Cloacimonetes bacterium]|nr:DUF6485 family protein [Candidatus Cloacimonadota bacterium]